MEIIDQRVAEFRLWAEQRLGIGSGLYPGGEDLLSAVMSCVDERERRWQEAACDQAKPENMPEFLQYLDRAFWESR